MRSLYVGPTYRGSNAACWRDAFLRLGHEVSVVDSEQLAPLPTRIDRKIVARIVRHPGSRRVRTLNDAVNRSAAEVRPQLTFFAQGKYLSGETVRNCGKHGLTCVYMNDDMFNPVNQTPTFHEVVMEVDCVLTTKTFNVPEFYAAGAKSVLYLPNAYDPEIHFRVQADAAYQCDVGFIGTFRTKRADDLEKIIRSCGHLVTKVWGGNWQKMKRLHYKIPRNRWPALARSVAGSELFCEDYSRAIGSAGIVLGLLNDANRDLHTSRSFEIPACGGFMLAERTTEHQAYFEEDREAVYFGDFEELVDKIRYYAMHGDERKRIASAGYERCVRSDYRYTDRAASVLKAFSRSAMCV